ncbi:hypothetical protein FRB95_000365 [Tulasnella sp. JGI-2019a]|nr:hypothetical protein FRB95_000365 [Tulasnella sp. JGI-2019a]
MFDLAALSSCCLLCDLDWFVVCKHASLGSPKMLRPYRASNKPKNNTSRLELLSSPVIRDVSPLLPACQNPARGFNSEPETLSNHPFVPGPPQSVSQPSEVDMMDRLDTTSTSAPMT